MIKFVRHISFVLLICFGFSSFAVYPDGITRGIENAIRAGDASNLARYFNSSIQLKIEDKRQVYSKRQAEAIMDNFFTLNRPIKYEVSGIRESDLQKTIVGKLYTSQQTYRLLYRISDYNGRQLISYIEIEPSS